MRADMRNNGVRGAMDTVAECLFSHRLSLETSVEREWIEHTICIRRQYPLHHRPHYRTRSAFDGKRTQAARVRLLWL